MDRKAHLLELREETNRFLDKIEAIPNLAVNWGDLQCVETRFVVTDTDDEYYEVLVGEASPDAVQLHQKIQEALSSKGYDNVRVVTDW